VQNPFGDDAPLNRFILISIILHAILFFALPDLGSLLEVDAPGLAGGGVVQVMHVETSVNPRQSPVTDPLSQSTVPRVTEPRPQIDEPPQEQATAEPEEAQVPEAQVEQASPVEPDPEPVTEVEPVEPEVPEMAEEVPEVPEVPEAPEVPEVPEVPENVEQGELLTSPEGPEVVVETEPREPVQPPAQTRPEPQERPSDQSGSGTGTEGASDESGTAQSGTGTAETAPPAPPPPASGRDLHGGGAPLYPKNAEHDQVEGIVFLAIDVSAAGVLQEVTLERGSGDERLDFQAVSHIQNRWFFESQPYDYRMEVAVVFAKEGDSNRIVPRLEYGEVSWLNAP